MSAEPIKFPRFFIYFYSFIFIFYFYLFFFFIHLIILSIYFRLCIRVRASVCEGEIELGGSFLRGKRSLFGWSLWWFVLIINKGVQAYDQYWIICTSENNKETKRSNRHDNASIFDRQTFEIETGVSGF